MTGGQFKGRIIKTPSGYGSMPRPTLSVVRESVFNILGSYFKDFSSLSFLDMFAGSGIMALEAYSRSFKKVFAIEKDAKVFYSIKEIYSGLEADINLVKADSLKITAKLDEDFDVIYIDPPWNFDYEPILNCAVKKLKKDGILIVESDKTRIKKGAKISCQINDTEILPFKEKIYGRCKLDFIKFS